MKKPTAKTRGKTDAKSAGGFASLEPAQKILLVDQVLDAEVRPGLKSDGGGLRIVDLEGYVLRIRYEGSCASCPISRLGTLSFIENVLRKHLDHRLSVIPL